MINRTYEFCYMDTHVKTRQGYHRLLYSKLGAGQSEVFKIICKIAVFAFGGYVQSSSILYAEP